MHALAFYRAALPAVPTLLAGFLCREGAELVRAPSLADAVGLPACCVFLDCSMAGEISGASSHPERAGLPSGACAWSQGCAGLFGVDRVSYSSHDGMHAEALA